MRPRGMVNNDLGSPLCFVVDDVFAINSSYTHVFEEHKEGEEGNNHFWNVNVLVLWWFQVFIFIECGKWKFWR
jgi:hypothetical protein